LRVSRGFALALLTLVFGAPGAAASPGGVWKKLHRPLHLPELAAGADCPVSPIDRQFAFGRYGVGAGLGRGPAYPNAGSAALTVGLPPTGLWAESAWSGAKVLWFVSPAYRGPVLIRGRRLDGSSWVRFGDGKVPASELRIPAGSSLRSRTGTPSSSRRRSPVDGCLSAVVMAATVRAPRPPRIG